MTAFASPPTKFGSRLHISSQGGKETGAKAFLYSGCWSVTCMRRLSPQTESRTFLSCSLTCNDRIVLTLVDYLLNFGNNLNLIVRLNAMLQEYAGANRIKYVDYHSAMKDDHGGLSTELAKDGVHPTREGYDIMKSLLLKALK